jgi:hypothetical protein
MKGWNGVGRRLRESWPPEKCQRQDEMRRYSNNTAWPPPDNFPSTLPPPRSHAACLSPRYNRLSQLSQRSHDSF